MNHFLSTISTKFEHSKKANDYFSNIYSPSNSTNSKKTKPSSLRIGKRKKSMSALYALSSHDKRREKSIDVPAQIDLNKSRIPTKSFFGLRNKELVKAFGNTTSEFPITSKQSQANSLKDYHPTIQSRVEGRRLSIYDKKRIFDSHLVNETKNLFLSMIKNKTDAKHSEYKTQIGEYKRMRRRRHSFALKSWEFDPRKIPEVKFRIEEWLSELHKNLKSSFNKRNLVSCINSIVVHNQSDLSNSIILCRV